MKKPTPENAAIMLTMPGWHYHTISGRLEWLTLKIEEQAAEIAALKTERPTGPPPAHKKQQFSDAQIAILTKSYHLNYRHYACKTAILTHSETLGGIPHPAKILERCEALESARKYQFQDLMARWVCGEAEAKATIYFSKALGTLEFKDKGFFRAFKIK